MGKGRKNKTYELEEKPKVPWTVNMSAPARHLSKDKLGAVIFQCKDHTITECKNDGIFGLPAPHNSYVKNVRIGLKLYLFNCSDRKLHGIFEATSTGQMNIDRHAWAASEGVENTPYPSQVRVRELSKCRPLLEEEFKPILASNYYTKRLFWFELDHEQDKRLMKLFLSSPLPKKVPRPPNVAKKKAFEVLPISNVNTFEVLSSSNVNENAVEKIKYEDLDEDSEVSEARLRENECSYTSLGYTDSLDSKKKWSQLFKPSSSSCVVKNEEDLKLQKKSSMTDCLDDEQKFASSSDGWSKPPPEACLNDCDPYVVECWEDSAFVDNSVEDIYENKVQYPQCQDPDTDKPNVTEASSENREYLDEDGELMPSELNSLLAEGKALFDIKEKVRSGTDLPVVENYERNQDQFNLTEKAFQVDKSAMPAVVLTDAQSSDNQYLITKLMQEVGRLKLSDVKKRLRIECLEELVHSKVGSDQLNSGYKSDYVFSSTRDNCNRENGASHNHIAEETVFIVGGFNGYSWLSDLSLYSPSKDRVISLSPMTFTRSHASLAKLNGELYIFGGAHDGVWYDTVESYNPFNNRWIRRPFLNRKKGCMAGASMYETIFAMGGGNGEECFAEVELFDLHIGSWLLTESMLEKEVGYKITHLDVGYRAEIFFKMYVVFSMHRSTPAAANLNGALYVAGGYDGRDYLRSVERFDPRQHAWTKLNDMNLKRGCHSLVAFNEKLYAIGGYDGDTMTSSVEVFDPRIGSWMMVEPMKASRGYFGSFTIGGKIYIIGGVHGDRDLDLVECYDEDSGWQMIGWTALGKRSFFSAIVL